MEEDWEAESEAIAERQRRVAFCTREKAVHRSPPNFLSDNEKLAEAEKNSADREKKARKEAANRRTLLRSGKSGGRAYEIVL